MGEPAFYPPPAVLKALREAGGGEGAPHPITRYTAVAGTQELRYAIAADQVSRCRVISTSLTRARHFHVIVTSLTRHPFG